MFFRNAKPKVESFEERIAGLKELGFAAKMQSAGRCLVTRAGCGAVIEDLGDGKMGIAIGKAGVLVGGGWLAVWAIALWQLLAAVRRLARPFILTRNELSQDWQALKKRL